MVIASGLVGSDTDGDGGDPSDLGATVYYDDDDDTTTNTDDEDSSTSTSSTSTTTDDDAEDNPFGADHTIGTGNSYIEDPMQAIDDVAEMTDNDDDANDGSFGDGSDWFRGGSDVDGDGENETTVGGQEVVDSNDPVEFVEGEADSDQQETDATPSNPTGDGSDSTNQPVNEVEERVEQLMARFQAASESEAAVPLPFGDAAGLTGAGAAAGLAGAGALYLAFAGEN